MKVSMGFMNAKLRQIVQWYDVARVFVDRDTVVDELVRSFRWMVDSYDEVDPWFELVEFIVEHRLAGSSIMTSKLPPLERIERAEKSMQDRLARSVYYGIDEME